MNEVVVATTKVRIFKQITTCKPNSLWHRELLLLPQRYVFSSKSQQQDKKFLFIFRCCCYHKGTYFQANHNLSRWWPFALHVVVATTKVRIFKQITTTNWFLRTYYCCCCYHKGTYFQANHNVRLIRWIINFVVVATTKVRIFKQITTS